MLVKKFVLCVAIFASLFTYAMNLNAMSERERIEKEIKRISIEEKLFQDLEFDKELENGISFDRIICGIWASFGENEDRKRPIGWEIRTKYSHDEEYKNKVLESLTVQYKKESLEHNEHSLGYHLHPPCFVMHIKKMEEIIGQKVIEAGLDQAAKNHYDEEIKKEKKISLRKGVLYGVGGTLLAAATLGGVGYAAKCFMHRGE